MSEIKYFILKQLNTGESLFEYAITTDNKNEVNKVFDKIQKINTYTEGERNRLQISKQLDLYYSIFNKGKIGIIVISKHYPVYKVYQLFDKIQNEEDISKYKEILDYHQDIAKVDTIVSINTDLKEIEGDLKTNIKKVLNSTDNARELQERSERIKDTALDFSKNAIELKKVTCWQNFKWWIIGITVFSILVSVILIPILS
jgi:hypothetical protein